MSSSDGSSGGDEDPDHRDLDRGSAREVLELLTEPRAIARWASIPFELLDELQPALA